MTARYCEMCDRIVCEKECPKCGAVTQIVRGELDPDWPVCPFCKQGDGPHTLAHEGKP